MGKTQKIVLLEAEELEFCKRQGNASEYIRSLIQRDMSPSLPKGVVEEVVFQESNAEKEKKEIEVRERERTNKLLERQLQLSQLDLLSVQELWEVQDEAKKRTVKDKYMEMLKIAKERGYLPKIVPTKSGGD